ncbi:ATP-binding cassette domain-containing protein [Spiroplasma poulsonii]|uniref:ATP-binding cassette domain-containing protein n=1 Tax=Spiroplasma poulsonii TaxID=2138 RepID=UPI001F4C9EE5|nr:ATP-binding cassette domain-containing protein [Spiroplasma poulsonii]UNF61737.1 ATP-binding cassette domain-containing protein [Spiroplasma poulsonii]
MIILENISKHYGKNHVLKDINLEIKESESVAFLGANGSGKTTLVEIISGVLKPSTGKVMFVNDKYEKIRLCITC